MKNEEQIRAQKEFIASLIKSLRLDMNDSFAIIKIESLNLIDSVLDWVLDEKLEGFISVTNILKK